MHAVPQFGIVLVHSAFHVAEHFAELASDLRQHGFAVDVPELPSSLLMVDPGNGLAKDTAAIEASIRQFTESGQDVVVHMHGYGGLPGSEAVAAVCEAQRALGPASLHGRIVKLIYLASYTLLQGETLIEEYQRDIMPRPISYHEGNTVFLKTPIDTFFNATPCGIAIEAANKTTSMIMSPFGTSPTYCGWRDYDLPVTYIICTLDNATPRATQERLIARMQLLGANVKVRRLEADHSPYLAMPDEYAAMIREETADAAKVVEHRYGSYFLL